MRDHGRSCNSVFDIAASGADVTPTTSPVVITRLRLQASPMIAAAYARPPGVAIMTTRSASSTSSARLRGWPARSLNHPIAENSLLTGGTAERAAAVKNVVCSQPPFASGLTTLSLDVSSAMTLTIREQELAA